MDELGKVMSYWAKFSFTVENKMKNSRRKGWSHFKLNTDDWDIPFPQVLRIYEWIGKDVFIGENGINQFGILSVPQNIWPKGPEDIYF